MTKYRVTILLVQNLPLTSNHKFLFGLARSGKARPKRDFCFEVKGRFWTSVEWWSPCSESRPRFWYGDELPSSGLGGHLRRHRHKGVGSGEKQRNPQFYVKISDWYSWTQLSIAACCYQKCYLGESLCFPSTSVTSPCRPNSASMASLEVMPNTKSSDILPVRRGASRGGDMWLDLRALVQRDGRLQTLKEFMLMFSLMTNSFLKLRYDRPRLRISSLCLVKNHIIAGL